MLGILSDLEPGKVRGIRRVGVKSFNPTRTNGGEPKFAACELFRKKLKQKVRKAAHFASGRLTGTGSTVRDESVGSKWD